MNDADKCCENTDRELWREREGDFYADSIHVTAQGGIGIDCGGYVIVKPVRAWHALAKADSARVVARHDCRTAVPGHGKCDMCAHGHYDACRYLAPPSQAARHDAITPDVNARWIEVQAISDRAARNFDPPNEIESALCWAVNALREMAEASTSQEQCLG